MRNKILIIISAFYFSSVHAQELYPLNEPASNVPKGVLGVRAFSETYREVNLMRNLFALRLMYGILPRFTITATSSISNHHSVNFPANLASHTHIGNQTVFSTGNFQRGVYYPYLFDGIYLFAKYRFISMDGQNTHFRMAAYTEVSYINVAHDESEPDLLEDNKGYGGGLITTYLHNHFAASLTSGIIIPGSYSGYSPDPSGGPDVPTKIQYGRAVKYNLSLGYLLFPRKYQDYKQGNLNLYTEFIGKSYEAAVVTQYGDKVLPIQTPLLQAGNYVDICPGLQYIFNSNLRVDLTTRFPLLNRSYAHFYPVFMLAVQRYFYPRKK